MSMSDQTKQYLRQHARKKRGVKLKDYTPADLLMATDLVKEKYGDLADSLVPSANFGYMKYATPGQIEGIAHGLPHRLVRIAFNTRGGTAERDVVAFDHRHLVCLMRAMSLDPDSYVTFGTEWRSNRQLPWTHLNGCLFTTYRSASELVTEVKQWPGWEDVLLFVATTNRHGNFMEWRGRFAVCRRPHFDPASGHFLTCRGVGAPLFCDEGSFAPDFASLSARLVRYSEWDGLFPVLADYFVWSTEFTFGWPPSANSP